MKTTAKLTVASAALFTSLFFVMSAPSAYAEDYCITNGAQTAHGCGYPSMEMCRAASAGIGRGRGRPDVPGPPPGSPR